MWTSISVGLALIINFYSPELQENKKFSKKITQQVITGFPYQYFKDEVLTDEMVKFRIRIIYISFMVLVSGAFTGPIVSPIVNQVTFTPISIETLNPNQSNQQEFLLQESLLNIREGSRDLSEFIIRILLMWTMARNSYGFQPINNHYFRNHGHVQANPKIAPKLQENPIDQNNFEQNKKVNQYTSINKIASSLNPEYSQYQKDYYPDSSRQRFDTTQCSPRKFNQLAYDPVRETYTRVSIDEARAVVQAELENIIIEPTRPTKLEAKNVDLDYKVQEPSPWTHLDVKQPLGSEGLVKQGQTIGLEGMAQHIGRTVVKQKTTLLGRENGPVKPENVGHIIDLCYVPSHEKAIVKENVLLTAAEKGIDFGIVFLNDDI